MTSLIRPPDELANAVTHGLGFLASLVAAGYLVVQAADQTLAVKLSCGLYAILLPFLYGCSTLSHLFYDLTWRRRFRSLDQASIFLQMASSYTPFAALYLHNGSWLWLLVAMWGLALYGVARVWMTGDLPRWDRALYGVLGFLPAIALGELSRHVPPSVIGWILAGGVCFCVGLIFFQYSAAVRYSHAVWHLLVIAGSACHYRAILLAVTAGR